LPVSAMAVPAATGGEMLVMVDGGNIA